MSSEVKRYADIYCESGGESWSEMQECSDGAYVRYSDYAALEAENARLVAEVEELDDLRKRQSELLSAAAIAIRGPEPALTRYSHADIPERVKMVVADRDAAIAQLAAIQGGMGEVVEVVAYRVSLPEEPELGHWLEEEAEEEPQIQHHEPLMTVAQHQRITAAMAAEVEWLNLLIDVGAKLHLDAAYGEIDLLEKERDALRAELAELAERFSSDTGWHAPDLRPNACRAHLAPGGRIP